MSARLVELVDVKEECWMRVREKQRYQNRLKSLSSRCASQQLVGAPAARRATGRSRRLRGSLSKGPTDSPPAQLPTDRPRIYTAA